MKTNANTETLQDLLTAIANAASHTDKNEIVQEILLDNALINRLTRAVMVALLGCGYIEEDVIGDHYSSIRGHVLEAIAGEVIVPQFSDLAAIVQAVYNWKPRAVPAPVAAPDMSRYKGALEGFLKTIDAIDAAAASGPADSSDAANLAE